jgi:hypothetical protein
MPEYDQGPPSRVQPDGRFTTTGRLPGKYFIRSGGVAGGWNLQSITANGIDVTDSPIDLSSSSVSNVVITFTDLNQDLRGTVTGIPQGAEPPGVVVFPADSNAWKNFGVNPTRMRMTRASGPGGQFGTGSLPPGDYYIVAIPDEYSGEWQDPAYRTPGESSHALLAHQATEDGRRQRAGHQAAVHQRSAPTPTPSSSMTLIARTDRLSRSRDPAIPHRSRFAIHEPHNQPAPARSPALCGSTMDRTRRRDLRESQSAAPRHPVNAWG